MMNGWDGWDWVWMTFMMVAFWGGLAAVIVLAIKALGDSRRRSGTPSSDAMTVLETRFAKGEISEDEFEERRRVVQRS
jgi:putative membrane protein